MPPQEITYKTVGSLSIPLDLYLPSTPATGLPILVWFHGGGLLQGSRKRVAPHMVSGVDKHGYALVSADYRLAPQVNVDEIVSDVKDCLTFVREQLSQHVTTPGYSLDTSRIAVSGSSAGGYLALLSGLYSPVPPTVILAIYPITDPYGQFFTTPQAVPSGEHIDESVVAPYLDRSADPVAFNDPESTRQKFYSYMLQEANLASLLSVKKGDDSYIIAPQLKKRGFFLPTYVVHGDGDRFVGVDQADEVVDMLKAIGADYEYERPKGVDHLFDVEESVQMEGMYAFMKKHLK